MYKLLFFVDISKIIMEWRFSLQNWPTVCQPLVSIFNRGVVVFLSQNFVERCISGLRRASEFVEDANHYHFIYTSKIQTRSARILLCFWSYEYISNLAEVVNFRAYSLQTNQTQSSNASQHPATILLRVD